MKIKIKITKENYKLIMSTLSYLVPQAKYLLAHDSKNQEDYNFYPKQYLALDLLLSLFKRP